MANYFIISNGQQQGPYAFDDLKKLHLDGDTHVWSDGWPEWKKIKEVPELQVVLQPETPVYVQQSAAVQPPVQQPQFQQTFVPKVGMQIEEERRPMPQTHMAMSVFVTIVSVVCCLTWLFAGWFIFIVLGLSFLSILAIPFGIMGIVKAGHVSKMYAARQYNEAVRASRSAGMWSKIGLIIIIVSIVLTIISWIVVLLFFGGSLAALSNGALS